MKEDDGLSQKIRKLIINSNGHSPSLDQAAACFHMSARTLHRHLKQEGTSYKEILESVTHQLAKEYLRNTALNIQEVSYLLGYSDQANFRRAFKRMGGMTPSEYRKANSD